MRRTADLEELRASAAALARCHPRDVSDSGSWLPSTNTPWGGPSPSCFSAWRMRLIDARVLILLVGGLARGRPARLRVQDSVYAARSPTSRYGRIASEVPLVRLVVDATGSPG
jgi:hypothetical protein